MGTRPAALENATLKMFEKAQWDDHGSRHRVSHACLTKLRPLVSEDTNPEGKIFLKEDGAPFHEGTIGRRVRAFVVKLGIRPDKAISATDFRKWLVTGMKRKKRMGLPIDKQLLRRLMCHLDKTANEWYLRECLTEEAAEASVLIEIHTQSSKKDPHATLSLPSSKQQPDDDTPLSEEKSANASAAEDVSHVIDESVSSARSGSSAKTSLSREQRQQIDKVFAADLQSGIELRRKRVIAVMKSDPMLRALVNSQILVKKVVDRIRYIFENRPVVDPFQLPEESAANRMAQFVARIPEKPPSTIESGRVEWSTEETEAIQEALMFWRKAPTQEQIRQMFQKSQVLRDIFRENTFERICNKVKNEFRKLWK